MQYWDENVAVDVCVYVGRLRVDRNRSELLRIIGKDERKE